MNMQYLNTRYLSFGVALLLACHVALAQQEGPQATISGGYAHLYTSHPAQLFNARDGGYIDGDFGWPVLANGAPVMLGFGIGASDYYAQRDVTVPIAPSGQVETTDDSDFGLFNIEGRIAFPILFGHDQGFFLKPRLGAGLLIQDYDIDTESQSNGFENFYTEYHTGVGIEIHPNVQFGYCFGPGIIGAELGYMASWGDYGKFADGLQQLNAGAFFTWRF
jgi:hypothetical protein